VSSPTTEPDTEIADDRSEKSDSDCSQREYPNFNNRNVASVVLASLENQSEKSDADSRRLSVWRKPDEVRQGEVVDQ
jgi:hypothetical protein